MSPTWLCRCGHLEQSTASREFPEGSFILSLSVKNLSVSFLVTNITNSCCRELEIMYKQQTKEKLPESLYSKTIAVNVLVFRFS